MFQESAARLVRDRAASAPLRLARVSETFPPEINGVAGTVARLFDSLRARGHDVALVRPRQAADAAGETRRDRLLTAGIALPLYAGLRVGLPVSPSRVRVARR
jgi:transposase